MPPPRFLDFDTCLIWIGVRTTLENEELQKLEKSVSKIFDIEYMNSYSDFELLIVYFIRKPIFGNFQTICSFVLINMLLDL